MSVYKQIKTHQKFPNSIEDYSILEVISSNNHKSSMKVRIKLRKSVSSSIISSSIPDKTSNEIYYLKKIKLTESNKILLFSQIEILKKIEHSHVIKLHHVFFQNDDVYLIFDHCNEKSLWNRLDDLNERKVLIRKSLFTNNFNDKPNQISTLNTFQENEKGKQPFLPIRNFNENKIFEFLIQILSGLMYLHSKGIVHRNINLKSLLFKNGVLKISGFKFALENKQLGRSPLKEVFEPESLLGNPFYLAPELWKYDNFDYKIDVWSVGMVLINMIYKENPFEGKSLDELKKVILYETYYQNELELILSNKVLIQLIKDCLVKDPLLRITSKKAYITIENEVLSKNLNVKYEMNSKKLSTNMTLLKMSNESQIEECDESNEEIKERKTSNYYTFRKDESIERNSKILILPIINNINIESPYKNKKMSKIETSINTINLQRRSNFEINQSESKNNKHKSIMNLYNFSNGIDRNIPFLSPIDIKEKAKMIKSKEHIDKSDKEFNIKRMKFNQLVKIGKLIDKL